MTTPQHGVIITQIPDTKSDAAETRSFEDQFLLDLCARLNDVDWSTCMTIREPFLVYPWLPDGDNDSLLPAAIPEAKLPQLRQLGAL